MDNKWKIAIPCITLMLICSSCQKTPDKSAVVSRAGGLGENVIAEKLPDNEKRTVDLPTEWKAQAERGENALARFQVDLHTDAIEIGNTPVIEVAPREFKEEDLVRFTRYFAGSEPVLAKKQKTKQILEEEIAFIQNRVDNKEGYYGDFYNRTNAEEHLERLAKQMQEPLETATDDQPIEVKFSGEQVFEAEIGTDREATITASNFNKELGTYSSFLYRQGKTEHGEYFDLYKDSNEFWILLNGESSFFGTSMKETLDKFEAALNKQDIDVEAGRKEAEQLLQDLGISDMECIAENKIVWFSHDDHPKYYHSIDHWFMLDWSKGKSGYCYTFAPAVNGLEVKALFDTQGDGNTPEETYIPPFKVESIAISVTEDGIIEFGWSNMAQPTAIIAENTNLHPFQDIQERLFDHLFYVIGAPSGIQTKFNYEILGVELGYTYIPAFEKPDRAWMVPAWFFTARAQVDDTRESGLEYAQDTRAAMFNALDGSYIARVYD